MDKALLEALVHDGLRLADRMMRDSWATGNAAAWKPTHDALAAFLRDAFAQIEATEREQSAKLCDGLAFYEDDPAGYARQCAKAIRDA